MKFSYTVGFISGYIMEHERYGEGNLATRKTKTHISWNRFLKINDEIVI